MRTTVVRCALAMIAAGALACSQSKDETSQRSSPVTYPDGSVDDAPGEEVGDGWVSGEAGSSDTGADAGAGPGCYDVPATVNTYVSGLTSIKIEPSEQANLTDDDGAGSEFDWQNLAPDANHRVLDDDTLKGTGFPGSNSCVNAAGNTINNPPKDDILQVGLASNNSKVFLNVLRASGEGDMGYAILVTQEPPECGSKPPKVGGAKCDGRFLNFKLTNNDVLIWGHFRTGSTQLLSVHKLGLDAGGSTTVSAQQAIDFDDSSLWGAADTSGIEVSINGSATSAAGWQPNSGFTTFPDHTFAEGSIPLTDFGNVCGRTLWMTVISNSEGNDPTTGDVKDLISPRRVNFGSLTATAYAKPNCDGTVDLQASITGAGATPSCDWYIGGAKVITSPTCDYIKGMPLPAGNGPFGIHVVVNDAGGTGCSVTSPDVAVSRPAGIVLDAMTASTVGTCSAASPNTDLATEEVKFSAQPASGSASVTSYAWQSCLPDGTSCTNITCATPQAGDQPYDCRYTVPSAEGDCAQRLIKVTADDGAGACPAVSKTRLITKTTTITTSAPP